jgi:WD40 repeat protein/tRNA A-37 threonylcarbamoyl transferase component Bud32
VKPGARVGPYEVLGALGSGGAATVYRVRTPGIEREVALKMLRRTDAESFARFDRERRLLASLGEEQGFVPLLDAGSSSKGNYIVMPYLAGGTLRDRIEDGRRLSVDATIALGKSLARALAHAHEQGIVHRDVKPENVLFTIDGRPLLADLGLAKHFADDEKQGRSLSLSKTGVFKGTIGYMPREQMRDVKSVGPPADVFSLGCILYECLAGQPAFLGETPVELMFAVENRSPTPLRRLRPETPAWLASAIEQAMAPVPERRFADGRAFADALAGLAKPPSPRSPVLAVALTAGLSLLLVGSVLGVLGARSRDTTCAPGPPPAPAVSPAPPPGPGVLHDGPAYRVRETWGRTDWKHGREVMTIRLSPDGTRAASGCLRGALRVWDVATGHALWAYHGGARFVLRVAWSPTGDRICVGGEELPPRILDAASGAVLRELDGHAGPVHAIAWSPDGETVLTGGGLYQDGNENAVTLKYWNARTGALLATLVPRNGDPSGVAFAGKTRAVSTGTGGQLVLWDLERKEEIWRENDKGGRVVDLSVTPDGKLAATANNDRGTVALWDLERRERLGDVGERFEGEAFAVSLTPDGARLVATGRPGGRCYDVATRKMTRSWTGIHARSVAITADGKRGLSGCGDGAVRVFDLESGVEVNRREGLDAPVASVAGYRGATAAVARNDTGFDVRDTAGQVHHHEVGAYVGATVLSPDGALVAFSRNPHPMSGLPCERFLRDARTGVDRWHVPDLPRDVIHAAMSTNKRALVFADPEGYAILNEADTGNQIFSEPLEERATPTAIAFLDDSDRWLAGDTRGGVSLGSMELRDIEPRHAPVMGRHTAPVSALAGLGNRAISGDEKGQVVLWNLADRSAQKALEPAHLRKVTAVACATDGRLMASASEDGTIALWDTEKLARLGTVDLGVCDDWPSALTFEGNERLLHVGTGRGVLYVLEVRR